MEKDERKGGREVIEEGESEEGGAGSQERGRARGDRKEREKRVEKWEVRRRRLGGRERRKRSRGRRSEHDERVRREGA